MTDLSRVTLDLSLPMRSALGAMPVRLRAYVTGGPKCLPFGAPPAGTLKALERRDLIELRDDAWVRTPLGERVWEAR